MSERITNEKASAAPVVLVVEDELFLRCDLADCLREAGCVVLEAVSADRAMAVCREGMAVHVLITDIQLNGSANGWDVAEAFRAARSNVGHLHVSQCARPDALGGKQLAFQQTISTERRRQGVPSTHGFARIVAIILGRLHKVTPSAVGTLRSGNVRFMFAYGGRADIGKTGSNRTGSNKIG
jgi:CheY-like chemotaxis protein